MKEIIEKDQAEDKQKDQENCIIKERTTDTIQLANNLSNNETQQFKGNRKFWEQTRESGWNFTVEDFMT